MNCPNVDVKIETRLEPGAGPALAVAALDPGHTGLVTVEQLKIGMGQCGINLTCTDLQVLVMDYLETTALGRRVRCGL